MRQVELYGRSDAGSEMGGDLLDVHEADAAVTLFLADVSGHGVAAGVMMGMVKSAIRDGPRTGADLSVLLNDLNEVVCELTRPGMFVTFSCLRFDGTNRVQYALAGHLPILCVRRGGRVVEKLPNDSLPLGVLPEEKFAANTAECGPGDLFVLLTDGLTETMNKAGQLFGDDRIDSILVANADRPLAEIHSALLNAVRGHSPQGDDQTVFLARVRAYAPDASRSRDFGRCSSCRGRPCDLRNRAWHSEPGNSRRHRPDRLNRPALNTRGNRCGIDRSRRRPVPRRSDQAPPILANHPRNVRLRRIFAPLSVRKNSNT